MPQSKQQKRIGSLERLKTARIYWLNALEGHEARLSMPELTASDIQHRKTVIQRCATKAANLAVMIRQTEAAIQKGW